DSRLEPHPATLEIPQVTPHHTHIQAYVRNSREQDDHPRPSFSDSSRSSTRRHRRGPHRFSTLVTALEAHEKIPACEVVTERLLNEERRQRGGLGTSDSGEKIASATQHLCNKQSEFSSYSDLSSPVRVEIGDGRALKGIGVGDVRLKITLPNMQEIDLVHCPSNDILADIFTKDLSAEKFSRLRSKLGVVSFEKHIQCEKEC
ncbi:hypothetical protein FHG87_019516, partial [Trinorchestia longiramus]